MPSFDPVIALQRFGLGARPGDVARIAPDPRAALQAEVETPGVALLQAKRLPDAAAAIAEVRTARQERRREREAEKAASGADMAGDDMEEAADLAELEAMGAESGEMSDAEMAEEDDGRDKRRGGSPQQRIYRQEVAARIGRALDADIGFAERLVAFWANHFAIQANSMQVVRAAAGAYEREAIRPHVFGRFEDMLIAATQHPAMLIYLNNARSIGPNSRAGRRQEKGLNENHAREILELHTVGVDGGYTQDDVIAFARALTGWTVELSPKRTETLGRFRFARRRHEPGDQIVMGVTYPEGDVEQGEAILRDLARHPATARHIGTKLARYFVADDPPPALVEALEGVFSDTDGDLKAVSLALIDSEEAWGPMTKLKAPQEFLWSSIRALGVEIRPQLAMKGLKTLGQPLWDPPSPQGFPDDRTAWLAPDALTNRLDVLEEIVAEAPGNEDPSELLPDILGPDVSEETRQAVERAESREQGLALMLMSAEFLRR
ncbi:MAG TPA: DUF1800 domain-containing protein [Propylenella sp.]